MCAPFKTWKLQHNAGAPAARSWQSFSQQLFIEVDEQIRSGPQVNNRSEYGWTSILRGLINEAQFHIKIPLKHFSETSTSIVNQGMDPEPRAALLLIGHRCVCTSCESPSLPVIGMQQQ